MNTNSPSINKSCLPCLNICVALPAEAKVLVHHYQLQRTHPQHRCPLYEHKNIRLIISGVGRLNMARAMGFLDAQGIESHHTFLNVGIAGGAQEQHQQMYLIHCIGQAHDKRYFYPTLPKHTTLPSQALQSYDSPSNAYNQQQLMDMEGHAFFECATQSVPQEQVALLKIVSDVDDDSQRHISSALIQTWFKQHLSSIDAVVQSLLKKSIDEMNIKPHIDVTRFCEQWHFTHSQKNQLREYCRRAQIHGVDLAMQQLRQAQNAKAVLLAIKQQLEQHPYGWQ